MATAKITKGAVERLAPDGKWLWDTTLQGFGVRRQKAGAFYCCALSAWRRAKDQVAWPPRTPNTRHRESAGISSARQGRCWR